MRVTKTHAHFFFFILFLFLYLFLNTCARYNRYAREYRIFVQSLFRFCSDFVPILFTKKLIDWAQKILLQPIIKLQEDWMLSDSYAMLFISMYLLINLFIQTNHRIRVFRWAAYHLPEADMHDVAVLSPVLMA